ncbi:MAG: ATP-binding protein [Anaerolineae bacterium]|nr:ATP-binding protein [Thermoflexales bacterium]MDW8406820.1 ATP-binding protein [Anaerolineae bacterium]
MVEHTTFRTEALDLRREIVTGSVIPLLIGLGWLGLLFTLLNSMRVIAWTQIGLHLALLLFGIFCWLVRDVGDRRWMLRLCGWGSWVLAAVDVATGTTPLAVMWAGIACALLLFVIGEWAGVVGTAAICMLIVYVAFVRPDALPAGAPLFYALAPILALVALSFVVSRVLFRTLDWMSAGYATARHQAEELRSRSAELALALRSIDQTSFALARANEQLALMVDYAERARRSQQEFAAHISHELRAPLNVIIGFSEIVLESLDAGASTLTDDLRLDLEAIHRNAHQLLRLVNDILDLSQIDASYMTISPVPVAIADVVRAAVDAIRPLAQARGLWLLVDAPSDLPEIEADPLRVQQIVLNLVNNALRFTERGGVTVQVRPHTSQAILPPGQNSDECPVAGREGSVSEVIISVTDTGIGIPQADQARIFEPFVQLDGGVSERRGTGLGLTISKRFVEMHGGRMGVQSEVGVGSTFYFSLPVQTPKSRASALSSTPRVAQRREIGNLLVVEPTPLLSRLLGRYLQGIGVASARTLDEAVSERRSGRIEAVIVNEESIEQAGQEASIPLELNDLPIVRCHVPGLLSSLPGIAVTPAYRLLVKPVTPQQLAEALTGMLSDKSSVDRPRVLVVEDDEDTLRMMGEMLRTAHKDIVVEQARTAQQALACLGLADFDPSAGSAPDRTVDAVFLDLALGDTSGLEVLHALEQTHLNQLPICVVTGQEQHAGSLCTPYLMFSRRNGLSLPETAQTIAAFLNAALPGVTVSTRWPAR